MYKILIIEDETEAASNLQKCIKRYGVSRGLEFSVTWLRTACDFISEGGRHDLVFMDIDLPGINGLEAAELMRTYDPVTPLVFVTNLAQYAVRGYAVDALDFIVKPVRYHDFSMRMDRAMRKMALRPDRPLLVGSGPTLRVLPLNTIEYVESSNHDLVYHLMGKEALSLRGKISDLEQEGAPLLRISKSCIVNMDQISEIRGSDIATFSGQHLRISRSRKQECAEAIARYLGGSL